MDNKDNQDYLKRLVDFEEKKEERIKDINRFLLMMAICYGITHCSFCLC